MRAARIFRITRRGIAVRVRVLPALADVGRAYHGGRTRRNANELICGFTDVAKGRRIAHITLPLDRWTPGLVAHEVTHVADRFGLREGADDEPMAAFIGDMTDSICTRLQRLQAEMC